MVVTEFVPLMPSDRIQAAWAVRVFFSSQLPSRHDMSLSWGIRDMLKLMLTGAIVAGATLADAKVGRSPYQDYGRHPYSSAYDHTGCDFPVQAAFFKAQVPQIANAVSAVGVVVLVLMVSVAVIACASEFFTDDISGDDGKHTPMRLPRFDQIVSGIEGMHKQYETEAPSGVKRPARAESRRGLWRPRGVASSLVGGRRSGLDFEVSSLVGGRRSGLG
ncbi:uncharacterized protein LOC119095487 isoform X1 [Pollicipes pollicipes]|uniref:uncharacterized protein LOC119095487 isoform X1 n=1 Tax=Pollicipes pollicipes TaxID=41117 RepID=UPI001884CABC|nr:uncharacterized protein LOC119095487 isoform X1 [Pollicipes pollicipes]